MATDLEPLPTEIRPKPALLTYYALSSLVAGPFFFIPLTVLYFRYRTLRYRLDDEGISMRWGALFQREVSLNYGRIQDIHLSTNLLERWLGLGKVKVQTASASAKAEMTIEGVRALADVRDFLYERMRGQRTPAAVAVAGTTGGGASIAPADTGLEAVLREVASEVRALRSELAAARADADLAADAERPGEAGDGGEGRRP